MKLFWKIVLFLAGSWLNYLLWYYIIKMVKACL